MTSTQAVAAPTGNQPSQLDIGDSIKKSKEDNDPQTIFYLNPISADLTKQQTPGDDYKNDLLITEYSWATKIEETVQGVLGVSPKDRFSIQSSWSRASYRAKLVDYLVRNTPWLALASSDTESPAQVEITGKYHGDKLIYQNFIHNHFQTKLSEIPQSKLQTIENFMAEILALSQDKVKKTRQFSVVFPIVGSNVEPARLRVLSFTFDLKDNSQKKTVVETGLTIYQAIFNKSLFDNAPFDSAVLQLGKDLVLPWTLDIVV